MKEEHTANLDLLNLISNSGRALISFLLVIALFVFLDCWWFFFLPRQSASAPAVYGISNHTTSQEHSTISTGMGCDLSHGIWIPDSSPPLYTDTCKYIQPNQNCLKNGRPDRGYLNWRWKPFDCELPQFDAIQFLEMFRGKKVAFIGDSLARNHMQALQCALSQVEDPQNLFSDPDDKQYKWLFSSYNFTLTNFWSQFLVNFIKTEEEVYKVYLDAPHTMWSSQLTDYDMVVISTGYWYFRQILYYVNNSLVGESPQSKLNITKIRLLTALRIALRNMLNYLVEEYSGIVVLRTITVDHFEHARWDDGGVCNHTGPFTMDAGVKAPLPWMNREVNKVQIEEFERALSMEKGSSRLKLLNITYISSLRPDGHPGPYRIRQPNEPPNDCLHWCLPGPIDMWNQLLLYVLQLNYIQYPG